MYASAKHGMSYPFGYENKLVIESNVAMYLLKWMSNVQTKHTLFLTLGTSGLIIFIIVANIYWAHPAACTCIMAFNLHNSVKWVLLSYLFIVEVIVPWRVSRCVNSGAETLISTFGVVKYAVLTPKLCVSRMFRKSNEKEQWRLLFVLLSLNDPSHLRLKVFWVVKKR